MSTRAFFAVDLSDDVRRSLSKAAGWLPLDDAKAKCVEQENLHITLHFLGEIDDSRIMDAQRAAEAAAPDVQPFTLTARGLECVPPEGKRLRMVWGGVEDASGRLGELYARLGEELASAGFVVERRPFNPHVTLVRIKFARDPSQIRSAVGGLTDKMFGSASVSKLVFYSSELTKAGPIYAPMATIALGE
ncbi:MAG: RNA 2',3'-cyclic phosphodiesterase [Planctomycetota bacterium]|jgi:2'-5' RNA ligase